MIELANEFVARHGLMAAPKLTMQRDALRVVWSDDVIMSKSDVLNLMCFFLPSEMLATLQDMIGEQSPPNAMPAAERDRQLADITQRLFELELREEGLIMRAAASGLDVPRRTDADPRCVLGVITVRAAPAQAVA
jgi:hypothetical protein